MATFQHDLNSMLRSNGFKPTKRGGYKMHKRRDGVIELMVCKGNSKKPLRAWYRVKPRRELFVQSGEFERVPPWATGRARANASKGGMSRATAGFITRGGHQERTIIRRRGEDKEEEEEKDDELREVLWRALEERRKAAAREGRRPTGVVRIPRGAKARAAKRHTTSDAKLRERKSSPLSAEEMGMSQDMWDRMYTRKNPATAWDTDLTVPQLWREADGGSYPAMVELMRVGAYRPEIGKPAQWTKNVKWAKSNRGRARKNTTASPQARGFTFMHAEMGEEWAEWALSRQGIKHRTGAVAKANRSQRGRPRRTWTTRRQAALRSKGSGPRGGYTAAERGSLPSSAFLKPKSRTWPVADPRHAVIAIQYMTAGRGSPREYPVLIKRLAKHWPVRSNQAIWKHYLKNRTKIARKAGRPMPTLNALDKG